MTIKSIAGMFVISLSLGIPALVADQRGDSPDELRKEIVQLREVIAQLRSRLEAMERRLSQLERGPSLRPGQNRQKVPEAIDRAMLIDERCSEARRMRQAEEWMYPRMTAPEGAWRIVPDRTWRIDPSPQPTLPTR